MTHTKDISARGISLIIFFAVGVYTLLIGALIQLWILPYWLPELHAGAGMMAGADWANYHQLAQAQAQHIQLQGWSQWSLRPEQQAPAGIASALYSLTGLWHPATMLPLQCALFAFSVTTLHRLLSATVSSRWAILGVLPLIFFPSSAQLYAQLSKDIWSLTGWILLCSAMLSISHAPANYKQIIAPSLMTFCALLMLWIPRPYSVPLAISIACATGVFLFALVILRGWYKTQNSKKWMAALMLLLLTQLGWWQFSTQGNLIPKTLKPAALPLKNTNNPSSQSKAYAAIVARNDGARMINKDKEWLASLDPYIQRIDQIRQGFFSTYPLAGSMIDQHVRFESTEDALRYLPRALQIGWMAPFPNTWLQQSSQPGSRWMRLLTATEMSLAYIIVAATLVLLLKHQNKFEWNARLMLVLMMCTALILIQTYAIPNVGTLYRMRLPMWHVFLGVAIVLSAKLHFTKPTVTENIGFRP